MAELTDKDIEAIREGHVIQGRIDERLKNHLEWSEKMSGLRDKQIKDLDDRLKPVEDLHGDIRRGLKALLWIGGGTSIVGGGGIAAFWPKIQMILKILAGVNP